MDFSQVFSPVCNDITFRIVLICMILWKLEGLIFDVTTAFLTGDLEEEIYMECPDVTESISLSLSILFGTKQMTSGKEYYRKIWKDTE